MRNIILKNFIYILVGFSAIAWFVMGSISNSDLSKAGDFFGLLPRVVTIDLLFITIFIKWGWKLRIFKGWLVPFPNLNGTWLGEIQSNWVNPETGESTPPIPAMLTVKQSFSHISCLMQTKEMRSYSIIEGFCIDDNRQLKQLSYIYTCKPRNKYNNRSLPHDGSLVFNIIESSCRKLDGRYWTERRTFGEICMEFYSDKLLEELPLEISQHPVSEAGRKLG
ncbi:hypothetical protein M4D81_08300 [Paenibacillus sp. p3-SID867]|uniref:Cap15 family cyclic dinucleotide receptor domain-containing protein n=1 Tax=Paenibacillus sp. p3-SID867 TaxID=2916363 RepID=UPI0021A45CC1|nr:hypothetical protein [Paenibacillus sp. p3-SID867]MCT1399014.1 hypothetical protein [Paenibacillus sp. p3-SID867]